MIFIDTGPFLARYLPSDQHHASAVAGWERLAAQRERCLTSNLILSETFTLLGRRAGHDFASERARQILDSKALRVLRPGEPEEREAVELFAKYSDQKVSFSDCVSFILMRRNRVRHAFSFDRHFIQAGFELWSAS